MIGIRVVSFADGVAGLLFEHIPTGKATTILRSEYPGSYKQT